MVLVASDELIELHENSEDAARPDCVRRFELTGAPATPLRLSAEVRTEGVTGPPGGACMVFFNIEYANGPVFWDTFVYPDTGSTPWRTLSCEVRDRGEVRAVEMHIRFRARGRLLLRNVKVEAIPPWIDDAECVVALFGDSTDMTNYLPYEYRVGRRLELLLRDRFSDRRVDVHGLAEGGETLTRLLESGRLARELQVLPRCDIAMLRYGLNDESQAVAPVFFRRQLQTACETIRKRFPDTTIVLSTTIPPNAQAYNAQAVRVAVDNHLACIPLDAYLRRRSGQGERDWHFQPGSRIGRYRAALAPDNPDGLSGDKHPNAYGAQMIAECYFEHLEPLVAARL